MPEQAQGTNAKGRSWTLVGAAVVIVVIAVAAAYYALYMMGGGPSTVTVNIPSGIVQNHALNYSPNTITVVIGVNNTLKFMNLDGNAHTVTSTGSAFDSGNIAVGSSWTHTFSTTGTFIFHCTYHSWMTGTITVKAA